MGTTKSAVSCFDSQVSSSASVRSKWPCGPPQTQTRGLWVVLLGPDGAGKTTLIEGFGDGVAAGFAGCNSFHLRAGLFRNRNRHAVNHDPHGQPPRGIVVTVVKLAYLLAANWLGYLARVRPAVAVGRLVLFDRYFPDYVVDPKRYRVPPSCSRLAKFVAKLVPQPDLYILLDADVDVLLERKQETTAAEVARQRMHYRELIVTLGDAVVTNASLPAAAVLDKVMTLVIERHLALQRQLGEAA